MEEDRGAGKSKTLIFYSVIVFEEGSMQHSSDQKPDPDAGNITASINFCEGPDFHHSEMLAEPVNVLTLLSRNTTHMCHAACFAPVIVG